MPLTITPALVTPVELARPEFEFGVFPPTAYLRPDVQTPLNLAPGVPDAIAVDVIRLHFQGLNSSAPSTVAAPERASCPT